MKICTGESFGAHVEMCTCIPESGASGRESLSFLPSLSDDGDGESWYWELLDLESESVYAGSSYEYAEYAAWS